MCVWECILVYITLLARVSVQATDVCVYIASVTYH